MGREGEILYDSHGTKGKLFSRNAYKGYKCDCYDTNKNNYRKKCKHNAITADSSFLKLLEDAILVD